MSKAALALGLLVAASLTPSLASAQDSAAAEALFQKGHQLFEAKDYNEACPKFAESFRLDPVTGSLLALAACHEAAGKLASAWAEYVDVATRARREGKNDRADAAQQRAATLEPKLAHVTIALAPGADATSGLQVKRDGVVVGPGVFGTPLPVDRGEHIIEAAAPGHPPFVRRMTIADGVSETVTVPVLGGSSHDAEPVTSPPAAKEKPPSKPFPTRTLGIVAGAAGVVALGVGAYFGAQAISKNKDSNANGHCVGNACDALGKKTRLDAISDGNTSTVLVAVGGLLAAGGVVLFIVGAPGDETKPVASVGPDGPGLSFRGRF